ncbi:hypothetical protein GON03_13435 [Nocardioides sp. MAH-18]|uniref:Uncharacterized protein n=1 Tax=Nocardioides agri TaxID=2682843 RepID=A0A6L6XUM4_9ACTN|nr:MULTISPECIES: hypothetical protein [unclassified Nocardioides]MBA2955335.1 hypothetical protein [Nocardioides sp. CGMCC 1.13656]MVQ50186.1 hypothetical protein [Nocardioides sp. MAH-18]
MDEQTRARRVDNLIPWRVDVAHRWSHEALMLRAEQRRRAGLPNGEEMDARLDRWLAELERDGTVVDYDLARGFVYVARRPEIDTDLIHATGD